MFCVQGSLHGSGSEGAVSEAGRREGTGGSCGADIDRWGSVGTASGPERERAGSLGAEAAVGADLPDGRSGREGASGFGSGDRW